MQSTLARRCWRHWQAWRPTRQWMRVCDCLASPVIFCFSLCVCVCVSHTHPLAGSPLSLRAAAILALGAGARRVQTSSPSLYLEACARVAVLAGEAVRQGQTVFAAAAVRAAANAGAWRWLLSLSHLVSLSLCLSLSLSLTRRRHDGSHAAPVCAPVGRRQCPPRRGAPGPHGRACLSRLPCGGLVVLSLPCG
jgi:hypothetical protein